MAERSVRRGRLPALAQDAASGVGSASSLTLPGIGPRSLEKLAAAGIRELSDLWFHLPLRYEDRTRLTAIDQLMHGSPAQCLGRVAQVERGFRFRPQLRVAIVDESGLNLTLRFFHFRGSQAQQFVVGRRVLAFGEPRGGLIGFEMVHPSYRLLGDDEDVVLGEALDPVYPAVAGVGPATLRRWIDAALQRLDEHALREWVSAELLPDAMRGSIARALHTVHRPPRDADVHALRTGTHPAQRRLQFEELLAHQLSLLLQRAHARSRGAPALDAGGVLAQRLLRSLPFTLTAAQRRVVDELGADLRRDVPMLRLVQGDVGSGKTIVAALAAAQAIEGGFQVALVAPTEILAEQHAKSFRDWFSPLGVEVAWLSGKVKGAARKAALGAIERGDCSMAVGTHALFQVRFDRLGLVIVDEQHRFGVHQRLSLRDKGRSGERLPHQMVMTATPIPRTLAMAAYADLDVSRIDELPPGRTPVRTSVIGMSRREEVMQRIRGACAAGTQAYWVCTLIDDSEEVRAQAAETTFRDLCAVLEPLRVALVHGRLKPAEKQATMDAFRAGAVDVLVATTVIEVGVDVPNASLMVIENVERLGLSQLHQLRGRVGRGAAASDCVLLYQGPLSEAGKARLQIMRETQDGFVIAEQDLALRGPGELLGTRQTGLAQMRIADLMRDADLLDGVAAAASSIVEQDPEAGQALIRRWIGQAVRYADV